MSAEMTPDEYRASLPDVIDADTPRMMLARASMFGTPEQKAAARAAGKVATERHMAKLTVAPKPTPVVPDMAARLAGLSKGKRERLEAQLAEEADDFTRRVGSLEENRLDLTTWSDTAGEPDWLIEPFIARGRGHALYAGAKVGKSYMVLQAIVAACVTGHESWAEPVAEPIRVLYLDYEMSAGDVYGRLREWGYAPGDDDLSRLHYVMHPRVGDLDTPEGGRALLYGAKAGGFDLVVIDTFSRAVAGDENDSTTARAFYKHTGEPLKAAGIAMLRLDHAGKDKDRGQRGSSAKNDDVDVVWQVERSDSGVKMTQTHARPTWFPDSVSLRYDADTGQHTRAPGGYKAGTSGHVAEWLRLGIPLEATRRQAVDMGLKIGTHGFADAKRAVAEKAEREVLILVPDPSAPAEHQSTGGEHQTWISAGRPLGRPAHQTVGSEPAPKNTDTNLNDEEIL